ncbi:hypothetical protein MAR_014192 [Mya arenaria]|uniref:Uncharacterized protein n=1 Tax=Mya arenaria TaxID=6604 RepID=A0ABY7G200_MYAAR|nr:hypothetical protein MAR_014192 [Mya arenaria]
MRGRGRRGFNPYNSRGRGFRGRNGFQARTESQSMTKNGKFPQKKLQDYVKNWKKITSDENVLDIIEHCHIEFIKGENPKNSICYRSKFSKTEEQVIS